MSTPANLDTPPRLEGSSTTLRVHEDIPGCWDAYVDGHPAGTPFHQSAWLGAMRGVLRKRTFVLTIAGESGRIRGGVPLVLCRGLREAALVSVPFRDHGGPLADDDEGYRELLQAAQRLAAGLGARRVTFQRPEPSRRALLASAGFSTRPRGVDSRIDLSVPEEAYWNALAGKVRQDIRSARKAGVSTAFDDDGRSLREFHRLHVEIRRRIGVASYPLALLERLLTSPGGPRLLVARLADGTISGGLVLWIHRGIAYPPFFGYDIGHRKLRANYILWYDAIRRCREAGARSLLFGTDSPGQRSLATYKAKWLAEPEHLEEAQWVRSGAVRDRVDTESARFRWLRAALARAPRPLFRLASRISLALWE